MSDELIREARRQIDICNACRYCEGFCSVFPHMHSKRDFLDGDVTLLANLCHDCRGCYYACQYTAPHEFDINIPRTFAEMRGESWKAHAWPQGLARAFERSGLIISLGALFGFVIMFVLAAMLRPEGGEGFYAYMSHGLMLAIFLPAFFAPIIAMFVAIRSYWRTIGGGVPSMRAIWRGVIAVAVMKNLSGGHGKGCNFEDEDRYSNWRRYAHQATMYGFLLCFGATSVATIYHYTLGLAAPYPLWSLPKLLGVTGGVLLSAGTAGLAWLKLKSDAHLGAARFWRGEMAFIILLFIVSTSGLALYAATDTIHVGWLLAVHLGAVLAFFLTLPYSKMVHGFYRLAALIAAENARQPIS